MDYVWNGRHYRRFTHTCARCARAFDSRGRTTRFCSAVCRNTGRSLARLDATDAPSITDVVWAAGIYEGEGHARRAGANGVTAMVSQRDPWILNQLRAWFGGSVRPDGTNFYKWQISGERARSFLLTVYVRLSPWRRLQARRALGWGNQT